MGFDFLFCWYLLLLFLNLLRLLLYVVVVIVSLCDFFWTVGGRFTIIVIIDIIIIIMIVVIIVIVILIIIIIFIIAIIMMNDIGIDKKHQLYIIKKMINIAIRATYYIFCCRNRNWDSPDCFFFAFVSFCFVLFLFCFCFCFVLFFSFNHPISSSICELPIRGEIYNCTFKKTNKASIIIIFMIIISISIIVYQPPKYDAIRNIKSTRIPLGGRIFFPNIS